MTSESAAAASGAHEPDPNAPELPQHALAELFRTQGQLSMLSGLNPFLLDDPEAVWWLEAGKVEVFTVAVEDGQPQGHRSNFTSVGGDALLFGMDLDMYGVGHGFLAVGKLGTRAWRLDRSLLEQAANDPAQVGLVAERIDDWVAQLTQALTREILPRPRVQKNLALGDQLSLPNGTLARSTQRVLWLQAEQGDLVFLGLDGLGLPHREAWFPLTPDSWVQADSPGGGDTVLACHSAGDQLARPEFWEGLALFHEALCSYEFINKRLAAVDEFNRLAEKAEHTERAREQAEASLRAVLKPARSGRALVRLLPGEHPFAAAARLVGAAQNIPVTAPADLEKLGKVEARLHALSRASRFRVRPVALRDAWWEADQGPILAQLAEDDVAVALLPLSPSRYEYVIPATDERGVVDEAFATRLGPFGAVFYRPFPEGPIGVFGLLRFGLLGLGGDALRLVALGLAVGLLGALTPVFTGRIFDELIPSAERGLLWQFGVGLLVAALVSTAFTMVQQVAALRIQGRMDYSIQAAVWDRLLNLPANFFAQFSAGDLATRAGGINAIRSLLAGAGVSALLGALSSVFFVALMFMYSPRLAVVAMGLTAAFAAVSFVTSLLQIRLQRQNLALGGTLAGLVLTMLSGVGKLRTSGAEAHAFKAWAETFAQSRRLSFRVGLIQNGVTVFNKVFPVLSSMAVFATVVGISGGPQQQGLSTGEFLAFNAAYGAFLAAVIALSDASLGLLRAIPLYERLKPILTEAPEIDAGKENPGELSGGIELSHLHFRYTKDGPWILRDVSLSIRPGEFIAFVGGSGSGKSTLMRLIIGFERPEKGSVYYDGKDLAALDLREVRQQMGVVLQDSRVLPTDIFRNIVGTSSKTLDDAWRAADAVGLGADIRAMPMGMHTYVSEGGGGLSGGQRQRLLLARAVVNDPRIILLDEATSALDNRTQAMVTESMQRMQATRIAIAHRLSTIIKADRICYLHNGEIAEIGNYDELMAMNGRFAALARRQLA